MRFGSRSFWQHNASVVISLLCLNIAGYYRVHAAGNGPLTNFNIPSPLTICDTVTLSWKGGEAPYTLAFNVNGDDLETAVIINDNTYDWEVDVGTGFPLQIQLGDSTDNVVNSSTLFTTQGNQTCELVTPTTAPTSDSPTPTSGPLITNPPNTASHRVTFTGSTASTSAPSTSSTAGASAGNNASDKTSTSSSGISTRTIVIIVIIVIVIINAAVIGFFLWRRRARRRKNRLNLDLLDGPHHDHSQISSPFNATIPAHAANAVGYPQDSMMSIERRDNGAGGAALVATYQQPQPQPPREPTYTYSKKVAAMRQPVKRPYDVPQATNRFENPFVPSSSSSTTSPTYPPAPSSSSSSSGYGLYSPHRGPLAVTNSDSGSVYSGPHSNSSKQYDVSNTLSVRTREAEMEDMDAANSSTTNLIPRQGPVREHDGGVRLAGGPQDNWTAGPATLPPAYGEF